MQRAPRVCWQCGVVHCIKLTLSWCFSGPAKEAPCPACMPQLMAELPPHQPGLRYQVRGGNTSYLGEQCRLR